MGGLSYHRRLSHHSTHSEPSSDGGANAAILAFTITDAILVFVLLTCCLWFLQYYLYGHEGEDLYGHEEEGMIGKGGRKKKLEATNNVVQQEVVQQKVLTVRSPSPGGSTGPMLVSR